MSDDEAPINNMMALFEKINNELPERTNAALTNMANIDNEINRRNVILQKQKIEYMANYDAMTPEQKTKGFRHITGELHELLKLQEQKLEIATGLKSKLEKYDDEFGATEADFIENVKFMEVRELQKQKLTTREELETFEKENPIPKKRGRKKKHDVTKEPSYCWCGLNNKDERDMIACDNKNCKIEWYHFSCVNITKAPMEHETWFCGKTCEDEVRKNPDLKVKDKKDNDAGGDDGEDDEEEGDEYQDPDGKSKKRKKKRDEPTKRGQKRRKSNVHH